jgi:sirohydrochlorin ferrochelatase
MKPAILIVAHGSRDKSAQGEFKSLVGKYRKRHPGWKIAHAFLELAEPSIPKALESLSASSQEIIVLPLFLFAANHVKKHIPEIISTFRKSHPKVKIKLAKPLGSDPKLLDILAQRFKSAWPK